MHIPKKLGGARILGKTNSALLAWAPFETLRRKEIETWNESGGCSISLLVLVDEMKTQRSWFLATEKLLVHCPDCSHWDPNSNRLQQETWASHASLIGHEGWMKGGQFLRKSRSCSVKICQGRWSEAQVVLGFCLAHIRSDVWVDLQFAEGELVFLCSRFQVRLRAVVQFCVLCQREAGMHEFFMSAYCFHLGFDLVISSFGRHLGLRRLSHQGFHMEVRKTLKPGLSILHITRRKRHTAFGTWVGCMELALNLPRCFLCGFT